MLFNIGVESPKKEGDAFGIIVPAFKSLGYECFSTADNQSELVQNAKDAILSMAEEVSDDGLALSKLDFQFRSYADSYPEFDKWFVLEVPVEHLVSQPKRINIVLPELLITRIDNHVSNNAIYSDRSDFLAKISKEKLTDIKVKSSIGFVKNELTSIVRRAYLEPLAALVCHLYTKGEEEFEVSLYDYLFSDSLDNKRHLDAVVQAIKETGTTDILKEAYEAIQEEVEAHSDDEIPSNELRSRHFPPTLSDDYTLGAVDQALDANIVVGWKKGGVGKTTITNLLNAGGFKAVEQDASSDYMTGYYYRILPVCSLHDVEKLAGKAEGKQSEFDKIKQLEPACNQLIVINNCSPQVAESIAAKLSELDLTHVAVLQERQFLSDCGDGAKRKTIDIALKDGGVKDFISKLNKTMFKLTPLDGFTINL